MIRTPVKSSQMNSVGYNPEKQLLEIEFRSGAIYHYHNVTPEIHAELMGADSMGKYFHAHLRNNPDHAFSKVEKPDEGKETKA